MWITKRMEMCSECKHSERTHDEGFHEVCEANHCVLCFQTGDIECNDFTKKNKTGG